MNDCSSDNQRKWFRGAQARIMTHVYLCTPAQLQPSADPVARGSPLHSVCPLVTLHVLVGLLTSCGFSSTSCVTVSPACNNCNLACHSQAKRGLARLRCDPDTASAAAAVRQIRRQLRHRQLCTRLQVQLQLTAPDSWQSAAEAAATQHVPCAYMLGQFVQFPRS